MAPGLRSSASIRATLSKLKLRLMARKLCNRLGLRLLEVALHGKLQLTVRKDMHLLWPRAETPESYITMGFSPDLNRAAVQAVREMVRFLVEERHLSTEDAYMLTSIAADLHVTQIVD